MANEAVIVEKLGDEGDVIDFTVADGTSISGGTLLILTDPRTASASVAGTSGARFAGIASSDKQSSDGATNLGLYTNVIADLRTANGAITAGDLVCLSGANTIKAISQAGDISMIQNGAVIGRALETAAEGTAETIEVRVGRIL